MAFSLVMGLVELGVAGLVSLFGVALASPQSLMDLKAIRAVMSSFPHWETILSNQATLLTVLLGCVAVSVCVKNSLLGILTYKQNLYAYESSAMLTSRLFQFYMGKNYLWHLEQNAAELLQLLNYRMYVGYFLSSLLVMITQAAIAVFLLVGGLVLAPLPSLIVLGLTGVTALVTYKFSRRVILDCNRAIAEAYVDANKNAMAGLHGIRDMRIYRREAVVVEKFRKNLQGITRDYSYSCTLPSLPIWTLESVGMITLLLAMLGMMMLDFSIAQMTGSLALLAAMAWRLLPCQNKAVSAIVTIQGYRPYLDMFFKGMENAGCAEMQSEAAPLAFEQSIKFENIDFKYPKSPTHALRNVNFDIPKGGMIGVIGPSGAGKSTLIGILTALLEPDTGKIFVDGKPLSPSDYPGLRTLIGYVPQSPYLMDGTLAENVALSRWGDEIDEERVRESCRMAAVNFWEQLPQDIHTEIGERGVRLSGGQAQRVAIARALYAKPQILIFDEATSALDSATENSIQETIFNLRKDVTVVIIAHRLSTVEHCDAVVWLEDGMVIKSGKPDAILAEYKIKQNV